MRRQITLLGAAVLVLVTVTLSQVSIGPVTDQATVSVYFAYPATTRPEDDQPEKAIVDLINSLQPGEHLDIAMYYLSDEQIKAAILAAHGRGVVVRLYLEKDLACGSGADTEQYAAAGIPVKTESLTSYTMHLKFALLGNDTVITGSYNWTDAADKKNWENLIVIQSAVIAADFKANFENLWTNYSSSFEGCE